MATTQQSPDPIEPVTSSEPSTLNAENNPDAVENGTDQPPSVKEEKISTDVPQKVNNTKDLRNGSGQLGAESADGNHTAVYVSNIYSPQAQGVFYGGYDNWPGEWEEYTRFVNAEGMEVGSAGAYSENPSLMYPSGYGYNPQMPYGPYSPATTPLPSVSGDGQLFSPHQFPFPGTYYQPPAPPSLSYLSSPGPIPQPDFPVPVEQHGGFLADNSSTNVIVGPRPGYQLSFGAFDRDWLKSPDGAGSATPFLSPAASPQPMLFGQSNMQLASGMQHRPFYGFGSSFNSFDGGYPYHGLYPGNTSGVPFGNFGIIGRNSNTIDKNKKREKGNASLCSCNGSIDFLNEQNRGPRANRSKNPMKEPNASNDDQNDNSASKVDCSLYNRPDFVTEYKDAKFFIIKSYSEDNVHKSIKYCVWASTSNGNKKLDSAYREAKEKEENCPAFLLFSVNASAQFCGVAEMIGPVDFEKSVDYWQQDKWTGQFPVKWHIVKDVPNNMFRHIILENNDNKPVTNSRDTQEVKLEQGLEMLSIFKKHEYEASILDDFEFYEERERAMQERKTRQQQILSNSIGALAGEARHLSAIPGTMMNQITKSFADAVRLDEKSIADLSKDVTSSIGTEEIKKPATAPVARSS